MSIVYRSPLSINCDAKQMVKLVNSYEIIIIIFVTLTFIACMANQCLGAHFYMFISIHTYIHTHTYICYTCIFI